MKENVISGVPILLRTVLEAFADFKSLSKDDKYVNFMEASHVCEWLRVLKEAKKDSNPYLGKISKMSELEEVINNNEKIIEELKSKDYSPLSHFDRFDKAGMENEYRSSYNFLCSHSHNNVRALNDRHTEITDDKFKVIFFKKPEQFDVDLYSITLCDMLISTSLIIHDFFDSGELSEIEKLSAEWEQIKTKKLKNC